MRQYRSGAPASLGASRAVATGNVNSLLRSIFAAFLALLLVGQPARAAGPELSVAVSPDIPPYVMQSATKGIEVDLVREALPDFTVRFIQLPYSELETAVPQKQADVAVGVQQVKEGVFYSKEFITFTNYAISKTAAGFKIEHVADLKNHKVLAWQDAYLELGPEFEHLFSPQSPQRKNYVEIADQKEQVRMFWRDASDVIVIDSSIFRYFSGEMGHSMNEVTFHALFPAVTSFKVGFKDSAVRDEFNRGLEKLCQSGYYARVLERYHADLPQTVCN